MKILSSCTPATKDNLRSFEYDGAKALECHYFFGAGKGFNQECLARHGCILLFLSRTASLKVGIYCGCINTPCIVI